MTITITAQGVKDLQTYLVAQPRVYAKAMSIAINDVLGGSGRKRIKDAMYAQVAFPPGYLDQPQRLYVQAGNYATETKLEGRLTGRDRPTSLARFAVGVNPVSRGSRGATTSRGIAVVVKPGQPQFFKSGFLVQLRGAFGLVNNVGFAIRLKPGVFPRAAYKPFPIFPLKNGKSSGIWLLYGPSVNQVMESVAAEQTSEITSDLEAEFLRQWLRLTSGVK